MKNFFSPTSGFTLIEIMVTLAIFTLFITSLFIADTGVYKQRTQMRENISLISNLFSNARSMAINSTAVTEIGGTIPIVPKYGYGVHIELALADKGSTYTLFADTNDNGDGTNGNGIYDAGSDTVVQQITFFDKSVYQGTEVVVFLNNDENIAMRKDGSSEATVLFAPLTATPTILFNNEVYLNGSGDPAPSPYHTITVNIMLPDRLEENITLNTTGLFITRTQISVTPTPTP